jgi:hypothetical protein
MSARTKTLAALGAIAVVIALVAVWRNTRTQPANAAAVQAIAPAAAPLATTTSAPVDKPLGILAPAPAQTSSPTLQASPQSTSTSVAGASAQQPPLPVSEVTATHQMIEAHAPLRTSEVADPDSATNRQVLQAMVTKALIRAEKKP